MITTGSGVKAWRARMGFSRKEAAQALGLAEITIKSYELNKRQVSGSVGQLMTRLEQEGKTVIPSVRNAPIRVVGGGTVFHVRNHLALACAVSGTTARTLSRMLHDMGESSELILTRMADSSSPYETNADMQKLAEYIVADKSAKIVFWNPALCDYEGMVDDVPSGKKAKRLKTEDGEVILRMRPANKVVDTFRKTRKDLFLVAFKTTTDATPDEQYRAGLALLKRASANLVLANDEVTGLNMVIVPEEARYHETRDREEALKGLVEMALLRSKNTFTRSKVVSDKGVKWNDPHIPDNLRDVVNHCIKRGAYKPFLGKTVGHFAVRGPNNTIITSKRKSNFNDLVSGKLDMVLIKPQHDNIVEAYGGKPSVGGMSQKIIFDEHPQATNIVHFHCPLKPSVKTVPIRPQRQNECGSHQCGQNTSNGLKVVEGDIMAVMLDNHGPNIVYGRDTPSEKVIAFIEKHFDLDQKTGGMVA